MTASKHKPQVFPKALQHIQGLEEAHCHLTMLRYMVDAFRDVTSDLCIAHSVPPDTDLGADKFLPAVIAVFFRVSLSHAWSIVQFVTDMTQNVSLRGEEGYALATYTCVITHILNATDEQLQRAENPFLPIAIPTLLTGGVSSGLFSPSRDDL